MADIITYNAPNGLTVNYVSYKPFNEIIEDNPEPTVTTDGPQNCYMPYNPYPYIPPYPSPQPLTKPTDNIDLYQFFNRSYNDEIEELQKELAELKEAVSKLTNTKETMTEVQLTKSLRKDLDDLLQSMKTLLSTKATETSITKLQESIMWLGMHLKELNEDNPYPESKNPDNNIIHKTADDLKL